jgi:GNAT superfamily N-acetyltransferase
MTNALPEIVRCPAALRTEALALVLCELAPTQRRDVANSLLQINDEAELAREPLYVALSGGELRGAAWGQRQPGNVAVFWPPQLANSEDRHAAFSLAEAVVRDLDQAAVDLTQSLLVAPDAATIAILQHVRFRHLADLLYLSCEAARFPSAAPLPCSLEFEHYSIRERSRLMRLVERTYEGTLDCTALDGARGIDDIINGYQATGVFRAENWFFVRADGRDVGILLLADHRAARHWELMYMGLVPEVRGRGWGRQIAQYAQWLARRANVERLLVAVDAANSPAAAVYRSTGFEIWERRSVFLRFREKSSA